MGLPWRPVLLAPGPVPAISTSVTEAETAKLQELAAHATDILEVGSAFGYSAIAMALANPAAHVTAIDPHNQLGSHPIAGGSREVMAGNLEAYGVADRVTMLVTTSQQALPGLELGSFDLVFIDADHVEAAVAHDVTWALKLLRGGGVLACHDWEEWTCPGVKAALEKLLGPPPELTDTLAVYQV
jgi:predicted O-methyltransferase YrrM